ICAQLPQLALALRTYGFFRRMGLRLPRQMIGQGAARGFGWSRRHRNLYTERIAKGGVMYFLGVA
ncbi:MAG: hypothetical protein WA628_20275, partial [Terriglobales bacterium]